MISLMDKLLFGDNQFFGVNHMSEEKARAQAMQFQDLDAVMSVLTSAYDAGIKTFMCTTHDRVSEICDRVRSQPERFSDFSLPPVYALRAQVRQRRHRDRNIGSPPEILARRGLPECRCPWRKVVREERH